MPAARCLEGAAEGRGGEDDCLLKLRRVWGGPAPGLAHGHTPMHAELAHPIIGKARTFVSVVLWVPRSGVAQSHVPRGRGE